MATTPKIGAPSVAVATNRTGFGRPATSSVSGPVESLSPGVGVGPREQSLQFDGYFDPDGEGGGGGRRRGASTFAPQPRRRAVPPSFLSYAQAYRVNETRNDLVSPDGRSPFLLPDLIRGIERYENNLRILAGPQDGPGQTFNRRL